MDRLVRYTASDLPDLMDKIVKHSIGADDWFDRLVHCTKLLRTIPLIMLSTRAM